MRYHEPVLLEEVLERLNPRAGNVVCDGTLGTGGHAVHLVEAMKGEGVFIGLDRDPEMARRAEQRLKEETKELSGGIIVKAARYDQLPAVLAERGLAGADAVLLDLGINSLQLEEAERGFSFSKEAPLDARFDPGETGTEPVEKLVNESSEDQLYRWIRDYSDEKYARPIARRIVKERERERITTTTQLAEIVRSCYPPKQRYGSLNPATRTFQALRIAANRELEFVEKGIRACIESLNPGGVLCTISYHSGEDRITKRLFDEYGSARPAPDNPYSATTWEGVDYRVESRGSLKPTAEETSRNPRARSARLRMLRRIGGTT